MQALVALLQARPSYAAALRHYLLLLLSTRRQTSLYADIGILSEGGFFTELFRRLSYRVLPPALDERYLLDCLDRILPHSHDYLWIDSVPSRLWLSLIETLIGTQTDATDCDSDAVDKTTTELLQAMQVLSYRISAIGMEPELIRIYTDIKAFESPFLMQNVELHRYLAAYMQQLQGDGVSSENPDHVLVMLDQCDRQQDPQGDAAPGHQRRPDLPAGPADAKHRTLARPAVAGGPAHRGGAGKPGVRIDV